MRVASDFGLEFGSHSACVYTICGTVRCQLWSSTQPAYRLYILTYVYITATSSHAWAALADPACYVAITSRLETVPRLSKLHESDRRPTLIYCWVKRSTKCNHPLFTKGVHIAVRMARSSGSHKQVAITSYKTAGIPQLAQIGNVATMVLKPTTVSIAYFVIENPLR